MTRGVLLSACVVSLVIGTGVSGCGDGVLQTSEVERSLRDSGYPNPQVATYTQFSRFTKGLSDLLDLFSGEAGVGTDVVSVAPVGGHEDVFVVVRVSVDLHSGAGVTSSDTKPSVATFQGEALEAFTGGARWPAGFEVRRVRVAEICNATLSVYEESRDADDRFDRALGYLVARC